MYWAGSGSCCGAGCSWVNGSYPQYGTPFCNDGDWDTIPDYAEAYVIGSQVPEESTDHDKFDDGQEFFGKTHCPGGDTFCNYGSYPRAEYAQHISDDIPSWVEPPGDNLFVAAFPVPEISVLPNSWHVERVTTITTSEGTMTETTHTYQTSITEGQSSIADTVTWNNWEEISEAIEQPINAPRVPRPPYATDDDEFVAPLIWTVARVFGPRVAASIVARQVGAGWIAKQIGVGLVTNTIYDVLKQGLTGDDNNDQIVPNYQISNQNINSVSSSAEASVTLNQNFDFQNVATSLDGVQYAINQQGALLARGLHDISYAISQPRMTETRSSGHSWGGAQTTTHEEYEEHTITNGEAFAITCPH